MAGDLREGGRISLLNLHLGIRAYMHHKNGWPPLYPSLASMPYESAEVLEYCLCTDALSHQGDEMLAAHQMAIQAVWEKFRP